MSALAPPLASLSKGQIHSYFLRDTDSELFFQDTFTPLGKSIIPRNLTLDRPCLGVSINWHGRVVIGTANYTAVAAEAPQTIIEEININGNHARFGKLTPWDLRGATTFALKGCYRDVGSGLYINNVRQATPTSPFAQTLANFGNVGTYDLDIFYLVPVYPYLKGGRDAIRAGYLWMPDDWKDSLQIVLTYGDKTSFGTPGGTTTVTFSAYGSGSGSPVVNISPIYVQLGPLARAIQPAVMIRNFVPKTAEVQSSGSGIVLAELQKYRTRSVLVKTGTLLAGTSGGVNVAASLSDFILNPAQIFQDNKQIRIPNSTLEAKEWEQERHDQVAPQGYDVLDFMHDGNPLTMFPGDEIPAGSHFQVKGTVVGAANQYAEVVQEYQVGAPAGIGA